MYKIIKKMYCLLYYFIYFILLASLSDTEKKKGIRIINAKLGRDTTTAISQLQWSQSLKILKNKTKTKTKKTDEATYGD